MKSSMAKFSLFFLTVLVPYAGITANEPARLQHNPFSRPPSVATVPNRSSLRVDGTVQTLDIRATMVAAKESLVNVAGTILKSGDEIQGYTLLQVFEDHAVFTKAGGRVKIYVNPDRGEESD